MSAPPARAIRSAARPFATLGRDLRVAVAGRDRELARPLLRPRVGVGEDRVRLVLEAELRRRRGSRRPASRRWSRTTARAWSRPRRASTSSVPSWLRAGPPSASRSPGTRATARRPTARRRRSPMIRPAARTPSAKAAVGRGRGSDRGPMALSLRWPGRRTPPRAWRARNAARDHGVGGHRSPRPVQRAIRPRLVYRTAVMARDGDLDGQRLPVTVIVTAWNREGVGRPSGRQRARPDLPRRRRRGRGRRLDRRHARCPGPLQGQRPRPDRPPRAEPGRDGREEHRARARSTTARRRSASSTATTRCCRTRSRRWSPGSTPRAARTRRCWAGAATPAAAT